MFPTSASQQQQTLSPNTEPFPTVGAAIQWSKIRFIGTRYSSHGYVHSVTTTWTASRRIGCKTSLVGPRPTKTSLPLRDLWFDGDRRNYQTIFRIICGLNYPVGVCAAGLYVWSRRFVYVCVMYVHRKIIIITYHVHEMCIIIMWTKQGCLGSYRCKIPRWCNLLLTRRV